MPIKVEYTGLVDVLDELKKTELSAPKIAKRALYKAAGETADNMRKQVNKIKTNKRFRYAKGWQRLASPEEKKALLKANLGISKIENNGNEVTVAIGYSRSGYTMINGKRKPVAVIANSINHGTSFMKKQPFARKATNKGKKILEEELNKVCEDLLKGLGN